MAAVTTNAGPGALNTLTAMATAYNDGVPLLHVASENPLRLRRQSRGYFHDVTDQFAAFRSVTGYGAQVELASEIPPRYMQRCTRCSTGVPGPRSWRSPPTPFWP